jgi:putative Mg2+ transporter-C (MgtC) family protein
MYPIAALGTAAVITANVALRALGRRIDRHPTGGTEITVDYRFQAVCADSAEAHLRALLVQAITSTDFQLRAIRSYDTDTNHYVTVTADLTADHRDDRQLGAAVSRLSLEPAVTAVSWTVLTESTETPTTSR